MAEKADVSYNSSKSRRPSVNVPRAVCERNIEDISAESVLLYSPKISSPVAGNRFTFAIEVSFLSEKLLVAAITCRAYLAALAVSPMA